MTIVAVTGAGGFLGTHVCRALERGGWSVRRLDRRGASSNPNLDVTDQGAQWEAMLDGSDVVINLAGLAHDVRVQTREQLDRYMAVNASGAARVASAARAVRVRRFIQVSTIKVLGESPLDGIRFREGDQPFPVGVYAESKAKGEELVRQVLGGSPTECVVVRLPLVLGTPFKGNLALMEKAIRRGAPMPLSHPTMGLRTYVHVHDLATLIYRTVRHEEPLPAVLHARSVPDLTAADVARFVGSEIGLEPWLVSVPVPTLRHLALLVGRPELASKICDTLLVSDDQTRLALGLPQR